MCALHITIVTRCIHWRLLLTYQHLNPAKTANARCANVLGQTHKQPAREMTFVSGVEAVNLSDFIRGFFFCYQFYSRDKLLHTHDMGVHAKFIAPSCVRVVFKLFVVRVFMDGWVDLNEISCVILEIVFILEHIHESLSLHELPAPNTPRAHAYIDYCRKPTCAHFNWFRITHKCRWEHGTSMLHYSCRAVHTREHTHTHAAKSRLNVNSTWMPAFI